MRRSDRRDGPGGRPGRPPFPGRLTLAVAGTDRVSRRRPRLARAARSGGRLEGRVALVATADDELRRAFAVALAREGASVGIVSRAPDDGAGVTERLVRTEGGRCVRLGDVSEEAFRLAPARAVRAFGRLDVVVHHLPARPETLPAADSVDAWPGASAGALTRFDLTRAAVPYLRPGGVIVNVLSAQGYCESAHLLDYTRAWAFALMARGVRVNAVAPPLPDLRRAVAVRASAGLSPRSMTGLAERCVFLASDESAVLTGHVLHAA